MNKLLISGKPLMVIPELAVKIGFNEALMLQQIHYWVSSSTHIIEGKKWIYNTYKEWQNQLPFWSESTIMRTIRSLEKQGFLISANWNSSKMDKTKWYTINYQKVEELENAEMELSFGQNEVSNTSECTMEEGSLTKAIPESTSEITTEKNIIVDEVISYLNEKTNAVYKSRTPKNRKIIRARMREGFTLDDFKRVIDIKTEEWQHLPHLCKFLRPTTLFGTKFEAYLNQKVVQKSFRAEDFDLDD
ncbi:MULTISPECIES: conserved phage C-terminal domain-containing protein [unclassified Bacillus (in: firmicutes)]|uniref:conserved phage C-terminal domain-containing protein n=1 Tax=unclassified Bacillus (in: firmicutes) TaxID=185979 RepID=UPI0008F3999D|nr:MULTISPECIES: conserved phage C-terminal domain-containing protein [unclassified Bacillus (in: firmicutes)]SFA86379.1 phage conserved hypothetical protein, C-terminal domain-containing protein [Bacillus sp. UNCCL13]SFQ83676.1 phage conserved hypothetical protein, C-terminal domain-containing protein [Bacillus sp. cl95]